MLTLRRSQHEARIEIMPLIDVIFLLLTFFIYAMVLMVRAELLPMELREFGSADPAQPAPAVTISIDSHGEVFVDRRPIALDDLLPALRERVAHDPATVIYIAADEAMPHAAPDRLPVFLDLYDLLAHEGLNIRLVGRPGRE
jgi:biopolymer transport protein ExbD